MPHETKSGTQVLTTRRLFLGGTGALAVGGGLFATKWFNLFADATAAGALSVEAAFQEAAAERIYLIDIRLSLIHI